MVAWRVAEILLHAQVTLRGLDRSVAQRYLDLLDRGLALVRQFRIRPTQVMGGEVRESQRGRVLAQDPPINDPVGQAK
jgi:hypothetical protein